MLYSAFTLALAGFAAATPVKTQQWPTQALQKGFNLVVNVTDLSRDFKDTPVHGLSVIGVHAGAGLNQPTVGKASHKAAGFYGTTDKDVHQAITGPTPYSVFMTDEPTEGNLYGLSFSIADEGTKGIGASTKPASDKNRCSVLHAARSGTFVVCDTGIQAPEHQKLEVGFLEGLCTKVPGNCVAVNLLPECAPLDLSEATYPHQNVAKSLCYVDRVSSIKWSKYQC